MPKEGRLAKGLLRVVAPERRAKEAIDAGTWTLRSWPMPDPAEEAKREAEAIRPGEPTPVNLYREVWPGCFQLAFRAGTPVTEDETEGLVTHDQRDRVLRGGTR